MSLPLSANDAAIEAGKLVRRPAGRNHQFDLLRIVFATLVLLSHAPAIADGNRSRELLTRLTRSPVTCGVVGVDGFFLLSGYLIVRSWLGDPELLNYLRKRVLRIVPGYLVAVILSTLIVGLLAPGVPEFFTRFDVHFLTGILLLRTPSTPPVFPGLPFPVVNGALYTIAYEFRCYLLVALLGLCGLLRKPGWCLAVAVLLLPALLYARMLWPGQMEALAGHVLGFRLTAVFLVGAGFYLFRNRVPFRPWLALGAAVLLTAVFVFARARAEVALVLCGGYLMFYLGRQRLPSLSWMNRFPDISYGIYLYGWPVESLWIWYRRGSPWITFLVSTILCFGLGWLSWHFIERPALSLKRRPTAPLAAG